MQLAEVKNPKGLRLTKSDTDGVWLHFEVDGKDVAGIRLDNDPHFPGWTKNRNVWAEGQFSNKDIREETK